MIASGLTLQNRANFFFSSFGILSLALQTRISGDRPMDLSSLTECCVGLVFNSPAFFKNGTRVKCINDV